MTKEEQLKKALKFVRSIRRAFIQHGDNDLNDIPVDDVINWADEIIRAEEVKE